MTKKDFEMIAQNYAKFLDYKHDKEPNVELAQANELMGWLVSGISRQHPTFDLKKFQSAVDKYLTR